MYNNQWELMNMQLEGLVFYAFREAWWDVEYLFSFSLRIEGEDHLTKVKVNHLMVTSLRWMGSWLVKQIVTPIKMMIIVISMR
jgi:hypothetical protein